MVFEPGVYLTGSLFIKEGVELRIDKGVELKGSQHFEDYPEIDTRIAGIEMRWPAALLNILNKESGCHRGRESECAGKILLGQVLGHAQGL